MQDILRMIEEAKRSGNVKQYVLSHVPTRADPLTLKYIEMVKNNDTRGMEQMCRNICKEQGINIEELLKMIK